MDKDRLIKELFQFIFSSPTQFQTVERLTDIFRRKGFSELKEEDRWRLEEGGKYYAVRDQSSLVAFKIGRGEFAEKGARITGAHTDSPGLKIKARPAKPFGNYLSLGVEVYGSPILSSWFDRDLSIAGRVSFLEEDGGLGTALIDFRRPVAFIPNLAIHLTPKAGGEKDINKQKELPPLFMQLNSGEIPFASFKELLRLELLKTHPGMRVKEVPDHDLWLYDTQEPVRIGYGGEFISGPRLDNLLSCFIGASALANSDSDAYAMLVCSDHEEVGSVSFKGAAGNFLKSVTRRIAPDREDFSRAIARSVMVSADNAHGVHPNYRERHDESHGPILNHGPVIKLNANQRYTTTAETSSLFKLVCRQSRTPFQTFISRSDLPCGSTIGPAASADLGVKSLDIGLATFGMHSIREICGTEDVWHLYKALAEFYKGTSY